MIDYKCGILKKIRYFPFAASNLDIKEGLPMVIQPTMSPQAIVDVWDNTRAVFKAYDVLLSDRQLTELVEPVTLPLLLRDLNEMVGSTPATCTGGG